MKHTGRFIVFSLLLFWAAAPAPAVSGEAEDHASERAELLAIQEAALENPDDTEAFERFLAILPRSGDDYVVEGDIALSEEGVRDYLRRRATRDPQLPPGGELVWEIDSAGNPRILPPDRRVQEYAFDVDSFPDRQTLEHTIGLAEQAARSWEEACPFVECRVDFVHQRHLDGAPVPGRDVDFVVRYSTNLGDGVLAKAFFPKDDEARRVLEVAPILFTTGLSDLGVMIHEFGHILGYWHEQFLGQVAGCFVSPTTRQFVDTSLRTLGPQDTKSPMHYPCGPVTNYADKLSPLDISTHRRMYGQ